MWLSFWVLSFLHLECTLSTFARSFVMCNSLGRLMKEACHFWRNSYKIRRLSVWIEKLQHPAPNSCPAWCDWRVSETRRQMHFCQWVGRTVKVTMMDHTAIITSVTWGDQFKAKKTWILHWRGNLDITIWQQQSQTKRRLTNDSTSTNTSVT